MNLTHEKYLRRITGIPDHKAIIADKVKERVDRIEKAYDSFLWSVHGNAYRDVGFYY